MTLLAFQENPSETTTTTLGTTTTEPTTNECEKPEWIGDTYCDDETNNAACNWDGGDCCNNNNPDWKEYCTICECIINL